MLVGLTGGIGSGKSTVAEALKRLGCPVYDTDREAKRIITEDAEVRAAIEALFGSEVFEGNVYRTDIVSKRVFSDRSLLSRLNGIVHPAVGHDLKQWAEAQTAEGNAICFAECAILFESGIAEVCDRTVCVSAPMDVRISRTMARDKAPREAVMRRIAAQMSEEERLERSDIRVVNDGSVAVDRLAEELMEKLRRELQNRIILYS